MRHSRKLSSYLQSCNCSMTSKWDFFLFISLGGKFLISKWAENCSGENWQHKRRTRWYNKIYCSAPTVASDFINHFIKFQLLRDVRVQKKKLCNKNLIFLMNKQVWNGKKEGGVNYNIIKKNYSTIHSYKRSVVNHPFSFRGYYACNADDCMRKPLSVIILDHKKEFYGNITATLWLINYSRENFLWRWWKY